jgi:hypothetical protein
MKTILLAAALVAGLSLPARAQVNANLAGVNLGAALNSALTVLAAPNTVNFALVPNGVAGGSSPVTVTTIWALGPGIGGVLLYAYFSSSVSALSNGAGNNIPSSKVTGSVNSGAFTPFTGNSPFAAGSSRLLGAWLAIGFNRNGTRQHTLDLRIDTTGLTLPPGSYTGVLNIQAVAL